MSNYDPIDAALNIDSNIEVSTTPEGGCLKRQDALKNVTDDVDKAVSYTHLTLPTKRIV